MSDLVGPGDAAPCGSPCICFEDCLHCRETLVILEYGKARLDTAGLGWNR